MAYVSLPSRRSWKSLHGKPLYCSLICIVFLTVISSVVFPALIWKNTYGQPTFSFSSAGDETSRTLGVLLHPEDHALREPTSIYLQFNITLGFREPDGVKKRVYLVNGQFPSPTIETRVGDELFIDVRNQLQDEGVSLHWHGLTLQDQNAMDGAVGITQCPIPPGGNFTYHITIGDNDHGTFWWHSHEHGQQSDGLFGGLIVHRPRTDEYIDSAIGYETDMLFMVGDWFHSPFKSVLEWYTSFQHLGNEPVPDSLLVNGRGHFNCSLAVPSRPLQCTEAKESSLDLTTSNPVKRRQRWRFINVGSVAGFSIGVSGAQLTPIEVDGGNAVASNTSADRLGVLYPGERVDTILEIKYSESLRLHISLDEENFQYTNPSLNPDQSFPLESTSNQSQTVLTSKNSSQSLDLRDLTSPPNPVSHYLPISADYRLVLYGKTQMLAKFSYRPKGFINHTSWIPQTPPLLSLNRTGWDLNQFIPFIPYNNITDNRAPWVDLIINNLDDGSHPFHLHGHSFYILASYRSEDRSGWGSYNPFEHSSSNPPLINLETPIRKDTVSVPRRGYVILRFQANNPGLWMLHCHMSVHLGSGLAMALHVGANEDAGHVQAVQESAANLCTI